MHPAAKPWPDPADPGWLLLDDFWERGIDVYFGPDGRLVAGPPDRLTREDLIALSVHHDAAVAWIFEADRRYKVGANGHLSTSQGGNA